MKQIKPDRTLYDKNIKRNISNNKKQLKEDIYIYIYIYIYRERERERYEMTTK